ncbi:uncharacterized protein HRG_10327 [Hirsutella rhossiliensis]|uniref:Uncharacterized protein n=1 Tax=Hirsutella rhossiliensis TaxID=111463 RepID=A0A9P8SER3_9HYPO|nr:uncharacterized protein HRG_10327 [Hirsutella rhossiliensis]KAH0958640.1 hypothetical protein HRG_10327 [Hirsutella rhossiliensis]
MAVEAASSWAAMDLLSSLLVRAISVICLALGTVIILPLFFCVGYDLFLWIWRQWSNLFSAPERQGASTPVPSDSSATSTSKDARDQSSRE